MPIQGDYTWLEKQEYLKISVPLKGTSPKSVDVFVTAESLKVNYSPFIIDILLHNRVDPNRQKAVVKEGVLLITLYKEDSTSMWGQLVSEISGDKAALIEKKQVVATEHQALTKELQELRRDKRIEDERHALKKQMSMDNRARDTIENLKQEEKQTAEKDVYDTLARLEANNNKDYDKKVSEAKTKILAAQKKSVSFSDSRVEVNGVINSELAQPSKDNNKYNNYNNDSSSNNNGSSDIFDSNDYVKSVDNYDLMEDDIGDLDDTDGHGSNTFLSSSSIRGKQDDDYAVAGDKFEQDEEDMKYLPPPRSSGVSLDKDSKVTFTFTPRVFPTPLRESKQQEEEDWIAKNRKHLKKHGILGQNLPKGNGTGTENDPNWLKAKGDDFFRTGDFQSALNAYCSAIEADDKMISCYANRSNCFLKLKQFKDCVADCDSVIQQIILESEAPAEGTEVNSESPSVMVSTIADEYRTIYMKTLVRRGMALSFMGEYDKSLKAHLRAAQELNDYNKWKSLPITTPFANLSIASIQQDVSNIETLVKCDDAKKLADKSFGEQHLDKALSFYDEALAILPFHVGCLSNRAACFLSLGRVQECIDDCSTAIELLQFDPTAANKDSNKLSFGVASNANSSSMLQSIMPLPGSDKRRLWVTKTLLRRGVAFIQLNQLNEAVKDYREAHTINPNDEAIKNDLKKLEEQSSQIN